MTGPGYMDIAPEDRGENVRREICLTLERMGIRPEMLPPRAAARVRTRSTSGMPEPVAAADDAVTFRASGSHRGPAQNGLCRRASPPSRCADCDRATGCTSIVSARQLATGEDQPLPQRDRGYSGAHCREHDRCSSNPCDGVLSAAFGSDKAPRYVILVERKTARSSSAFPPPRASTAARSFDPRTRSATRILPIPSSSTPVSTVYAAAQSCPQARTSTFTPRRRRSVRSIKRCPQRSRTQKPRQKQANLSPPPCRGPLWSITRSKRR